MEINTLIANRIHDLRTSLGFSSEYVAQELGIAKSNYSMLENGKTEIKISSIFSLAKIFKVPPTAILDINTQATTINISHGEHAINATQINYYSDVELANELERSAKINIKAADRIRKGK
jgi:transcriptional regulator with XRE-family HTH domain